LLNHDLRQREPTDGDEPRRLARSTLLRVSLKRGLAPQALTMPAMPVPSIIW